MFENPYLREIEALYNEAGDPAHDIVFGDGSSDEWYKRFHAVTALGLGLSDKKKLIEANKLLLFALHFPDFPDGKIVAGENPDFRIILPNRKIGFELRDVYVELPRRSPLQYQEVLHDKIVAHAHELYKHTGGPTVCADFDFASNTNYRESDVPRVAQQLANIVPASLASSTESTFIERHNGKGPWPAGLVCALGHAPHWWQKDDPRWRTIRGGSVYSSEEFLQAALDRKEKRLADYRNNGCDECWLLLVVSRLAPSSFMDAPDPQHVFTSSFDRAFFFQLHGTEITEMKCEPAITSTAPTARPN